MNVDFADRLKKLPPYLFVKLDEAKNKALAEGQDVISLGIGDPDTPTPDTIIEALAAAAKDPRYHRYPSNWGLKDLREAIAEWYNRKFDVELSAETEVLSLIGSKEGIAHLPLAYINPGDIALVPEPSYPPYRNGVLLAGGVPYFMPLVAENGFLPDLDVIDDVVAAKAKIMYINYPNNPTAATADEVFFDKVIAFAKKHNIIIASDLAYSEMTYDGYSAPSILQRPGAKDVAIEFHSLSKTYNMTGWRLGWACGNAAILQGLAKVKSNIDSGAFEVVQQAGIAALKEDAAVMNERTAMYQRRRDVLVDGLRAAGWDVPKPKASFYIWAPIPSSAKDSMSFSEKVLVQADIIITPGIGFGPSGEGYVRMALTVGEERLKEAVERIKKIL